MLMDEHRLLVNQEVERQKVGLYLKCSCFLLFWQVYRGGGPAATTFSLCSLSLVYDGPCLRAAPPYLMLYHHFVAVILWGSANPSELRM